MFGRCQTQQRSWIIFHTRLIWLLSRVHSTRYLSFLVNYTFIHSFIPQDIPHIKYAAPDSVYNCSVQFSSVQLLSCVRIFATTWTAARQASLSIINSRSLLKLMSIVLVMPSKYLILCHPLLLLPSIFPRISVFSNESVLLIGWPKYWTFSFSCSPSNEYSGLISFKISSLRRLKKWKRVKSSEE